MRYRYLLYVLQLMLLLAAPMASSASTQPKNWNVELELLPLSGEATTEINQLVPKQSVLMKVSVWYPATEAWLVNYPDWDMPGASIEKTRTDVPNVEREVEGLLQYGNTQKYIVTPVDIGQLKLRQDSMDVSVYQDGSAVIPFHNPIELDVSLPDGVYAMDRFLPAHELDVQQEFVHYSNSVGEQSLELAAVAELTLEKGEMLERRITLTAKGVKGSSIPITLLPKQHEGMQSESTYNDIQGLFGFEGGERVDSFFFSPGGGGQVELSPLSIEWWDLDNRTLKTIELPGASFNSVAVQAYEESIKLSWWEKRGSRIMGWIGYGLLAVIVSVVVVVMMRSLIANIYSVIKSQIARVKRSDSVLLAKFTLLLVFGSRHSAKQLFMPCRYQVWGGSYPVLLGNYLFEPSSVSRAQLILGLPGIWNYSMQSGSRQTRYDLPKI